MQYYQRRIQMAHGYETAKELYELFLDAYRDLAIEGKIALRDGTIGRIAYEGSLVITDDVDEDVEPSWSVSVNHDGEQALNLPELNVSKDDSHWSIEDTTDMPLWAIPVLANVVSLSSPE
jgi:hypothetical protein